MKTQGFRFTKQLGGLVAIALAAGCTAPSQSASSVPTSEPAPAASAPPTEVAQAQDLRAVSVVQNLEHPWGMAWLPDGSILITERPGRLRIVRNGVLDAEAIAGVPEVFAEGQGGLLDISLHPRFAENRFVYLTYSYGSPSANRTRVARAVLNETGSNLQLQDMSVIFEVPHDKPSAQHFGSRMTWLPDGTLLVSIGDGGNPPVEFEGDLIRRQAQNLQSNLGKIIRINDDGSVPQDNPFATSGNAGAKIWSYGHRNIQGLAIDSATQRIWSTEHGSRGGDELNLIARGENYGWPLVTHSREYSGGVISEEQSRPGFIDPKVVWTPAIAPSGLTVYRGDRFPQWQGDLWAGGLVSRDIRYIDLDDVGKVIGQTEIPIGQRVRDVRQSPDGWLYVLTDEPDGQLMRLEPARG
jgi:aldose sugar dehydrogenase